MTSRERVTKAINHQIADRVPIDFGGFQAGIHKKAYAELLAHLGINEQIEILDSVQQLAKPSEEVLERFNVDIRYICSHSFDRIEKNNRDGKLWHDLKNEFGVVWSMPDDNQLYMNMSHHPLVDIDIGDIADYSFPDGGDPARFTGLREMALQIRKETPYAISTGIGGSVYEYCWCMRGLEQWFTDMVENTDFCEALLDRLLNFWMDYYTGFMAEVGDIIDIVMIGDDLAGQHGPLFSPDFYRGFVKPVHGKLIKHIQSLTHAKICCHTCGSCTEYIPDLIENGVDILNPVQIGADNMDPRSLKDEFGENIVFWGGGIDAQHVLPFAKPDEVREHVRKNLEIFKPGGGYVFGNAHNIQADVPPENIVAMYEAAYEFGFYN